MFYQETTPTPSVGRPTTRRRLVGTAAALLALATTSRTYAQDGTPAPVASPVATEIDLPAGPISVEPLPYLFIQTSAQGSWSSVRGQPGAFWLSLSNPSPQTIVIRDQPTDAAGTISTALFFDSIEITDRNPLHAVISAQTATGEDVLIVALHRATYEPAVGALAYIATKLSDYTDQHGLTPLKEQQANFTLPPSFGATTIFITNALCRQSGEDVCQFG